MDRPTLTTAMLSEERLLIIVGGIHGAGKSTFCEKLLSIKSLSYITPEALKNQLKENASRKEILKFLHEQVLHNINAGLSFYFEHVMSGHYVQKLISLAKDHQFRVHLIYINLDTVELAIERIDKRLAMNGHDVDREKVTQRLFESRSNFFNLYRPMADSWELLDNSGTSYQRIASCKFQEEPVIALPEKYLRFQQS